MTTSSSHRLLALILSVTLLPPHPALIPHFLIRPACVFSPGNKTHFSQLRTLMYSECHSCNILKWSDMVGYFWQAALKGASWFPVTKDTGEIVFHVPWYQSKKENWLHTLMETCLSLLQSVALLPHGWDLPSPSVSMRVTRVEHHYGWAWLASHEGDMQVYSYHTG